MSMNLEREATLGRESKDADTYSFQAEINQLLSLIINTFYTKKEVFLRELISNASDALDKAKYRTARENAESSPSAEAPAEAPAEYRIRLRADKEARTLVLEDTGVGMTRQELIDNLGTIAQSGTMQFMKQCSSNCSSEGATEESRQSLIGQFGVGFYSAYLVADRVSVTSRANGAPRAHTWESAANGTFTVSSGDAGAHTSAGTTITLYLKEDCAEYADEGHLRSLIHTYSSFIQYPIYMEVETTRDVPATDGDEKDDEKDGDAQSDNDEKDDDTTDDARLPKTRVETCREWQLQNEQKPLWVRAQKDIKDSEYVSLYKALCNDWDEPLAWTHVVAEGNVDFRGILYVPKRAPVDLYDSNKRHSIKLFVKRVFVMDETDELIPEWLKFMRGVVDSEDMPLNISREMLQKNGVVKVMQRNIIKKSLELFDEMATERPDDYLTFYKNYSKCIKLGVHDESKHQAKLIKLLRYPTSKTFADASSSSASSASSASPPMVSLDEYVERMPSAQKDIYFITGETDQIIDQSPFLERLKDEGTEVLYMSDPIDEYVMQGLREYDGRSFVSCTRLIKKRETKAESEAESEAEKESEKEATDQEVGLELTEEAMTRLCKRFADVLGHTVEAVLPSTRLVKSPACLVSSEFGWSANMERIMRAQTMRDNSRTEFMTAKKIMEINPTHRIIRDLSNRLGRVDESESESGAKSESAESESALVDEVIHLLYESSVVDSGFTLDTPKRFVSRINHMISLGLSLDDDGENGAVLANRVDTPGVRIERVSSREFQEKNTIRHDNVSLTNEGDSTEMQAVD